LRWRCSGVGVSSVHEPPLFVVVLVSWLLALVLLRRGRRR